jgi:hypothetical protein
MRLVVLSLLVQSLASCGGGGDLGRGTPDVIAVGAATYYAQTVRGCFENGAPRELGTSGVIALSPDGTHFVAPSSDGVGADVVSTLDASTQHLAGQGITYGGVRWTPDGQQLAYVSKAVPYLADGDGANARPIAVSFPVPPSPFSAGPPDQIEWAADLAHVAFDIQGIAVLADVRAAQGQVVSNKQALGIAFSPGGDQLAVGQEFLDTIGYTEGTTLVVDAASLASREFGSSAAMPAWSFDGNWVVQGWFSIPVSSGQAVSLGGSPTLSPDHTQLALAMPDGTLHVRSFDGTEDRVLTTGISPSAGYLSWTPDGSALWYVDGSGLHVVGASDGTPLLTASQGVWGPGYGLIFGPDDWVAMEAVDMTSGFSTQRLGFGPVSGATFPASEVIVDGNTARWLIDDKIAFISDSGLHIAAADGSATRVACEASGIVGPQTESR